MLSRRTFCRPWEPDESQRPVVLTPEDVERHEAVTVVLQRKAVGLGRRSRFERVIEGPVGGVLFVVLLGVCLVLWGAGLGS